MQQTSNRYSVLGGDDPATSHLWEDVQALAAFAHPDTLPLPSNQPPAA